MKSAVNREYPSKCYSDVAPRFYSLETENRELLAKLVEGVIVYIPLVL